MTPLMVRALLLVLLVLPGLARAQGAPASLVADRLEVTADGRLLATGNVEAFYEGTTLSAAAVAYDRDADRLTVEGPIVIREPSGAILAAESATLDPRLENGLLRGARLVLDRRLQIAANRADRVGGTLTALTGVAATSCQVCAGTPPLWEIRARQVVHDEAAQQIHIERATFRVRGVPILWLPRLRLPDPANTRATGLLIPQLRSGSQTGFGVRLPVFVELGPSRDLTVTPFLATRTRAVELRYRQAFARGDLLLRGAVGRDDIGDAAATRGWAAADAALDVGLGLALDVSLRGVSDDAYLLDYDLSDADRLRSRVGLSRVGQASLLLADVTGYRSLREGEADGSLPPVHASLAFGRRAAAWGGTLSLDAAAEAFARTTSVTAGATGPEGRDVARAGAGIGWRRGWAIGPGLLLDAQARVALDAYRVEDDAGFPDPILRATPALGATLRFPLVRRGREGVADLLEPVVSLGWSEALGGTPPNEDSRLPELDAANLHALTRFPGQDGEEEGPRLSWGLSWTRAAGERSAAILAGQVLRAEPAGFSAASGLRGTTSDLLIAGRLDLGDGFGLLGRGLLEGGPGRPAFGKSEARLDWEGSRVTLSAAYLYLPADAEEGRPSRAAEWSVDGAWRPSARWSFGAGARYDLAGGGPARARVSIGWRSECVEVDLSASRRYTAAGEASPSTDLGLSINLSGFSAGGAAPLAPRACRS